MSSSSFRLIVGLSVGVPLVILIIVCVVVLYCFCAHYQNRKMARLALSYSRHHNRDSINNRRGDDDYLAPPPYTPADANKENTDSGLPGYSVTDPYAPPVISSPPPQLPTNAEDQEETISNQQTEVLVLEDVPLLSD